MPDGIAGIVLAGGAGSRFGGPKALARNTAGTPWVELAVRALREGGCDPVVVALGAGIDEARALVPVEASVVEVVDWMDGVSASLRAALHAVARTDVAAAVIVPVDTPEMPADAVARVAASEAPLAQATYRGRPGHPVLVGRGDFMPLSASASGDTGARPYLVAHGVSEVECGDLWDGDDVDVR